MLLLLEFATNRIVFVPSHIAAVLVLDLLYFLCVLLPVQLVTHTVIYPGLTDFARPGVFLAVACGIPLCNSLFFFFFLVLSYSKSFCCRKMEPLPVRLFRRKDEPSEIELRPLAQ